MPESFAQRLIAAHQAGVADRRSEEEKLQRQEDRKLQQQILKHQIDRLKIHDALENRQAAAKQAELMQGQPGQSVPQVGPDNELPAIGDQPSVPLGGTQVQPLAKIPLQAIPELGLPETSIQPQTMQELMQQRNQQARQEMMLKREENTVTLPPIPGLGMTEPTQVDKSLADNLITQAGQGVRQKDQQTFTAGENEKRLKAESTMKQLDRAAAAARSQQAAASRIQAAVAGQGRSQALSTAQKFGTEQQVKNFQIVQEAKAFTDSLPDNTDKSADDQALLYSFAKAMDPNSVVREGEYATVQKYAQSWASTYKFKAERVFENAPFLTEDARKQMKATIAKKADAAQKSYDTIFNEYTRNLNRITGQNNGKDLLIDYSFGGQGEQQYPEGTVISDGKTLKIMRGGKWVNR